MGRNLCSTKQKLRKGLWSPEEDEKLYNYIARYGVGCWSSVPKLAGLQRCGKSCRLRWINYLRPDLKRGMFSQEEEDLIMSLHQALGNRWAQIAAQLPGRTDNEIKNFWNSSLKKKLVKLGIDPNTHKPVVSKIETKDDRRDDYADQLQMSQSRIEHAAFNLASGKFYNYDVDPLVFLPEFQGGSLDHDHDQYHYYNYYPQQQRPDYGTSQVGPSFVDPACGLSTMVAGMTTHFDVVENEGSSSAFCWDDNRDQKSGSGDFGAYVEMGAGDQNLDVFHQM